MCDISFLRIASTIIEARERAGGREANCPVSIPMGQPKRVLCPDIVLMIHDLPIPRDVPAACSEKKIVYSNNLSFSL